MIVQKHQRIETKDAVIIQKHQKIETKHAQRSFKSIRKSKQYLHSDHSTTSENQNKTPFNPKP